MSLSLGSRTICLLTPTLAFLNGPLFFSKACESVNSRRKCFSATGARWFRRVRGLWLVIQPRAEPALELFQRHAFAPLIIEDLVATDFANREILGFGMAE